MGLRQTFPVQTKRTFFKAEKAAGGFPPTGLPVKAHGNGMGRKMRKVSSPPAEF
jgi:hypothetical protein